MDEYEDLTSDSSDEDYIPGKESSDEEVSDVEEKNSDNVGEFETDEKASAKAKFSKAKKRKVKKDEKKACKRKGGIKLEDDKIANETEDVAGETVAKSENMLNDEKGHENEEKEKERANALWADFMKDTEIKSKPKLVKNDLPETDNPAFSNTNSVSNPVVKKVTVTKVFDFAGEEIRVTEEVDATSKEAKQFVNQQKEIELSSNSELTAIPTASSPKKPAGLSGVLSKIGAKKKMSTLEKSRLDWMQFKDQEGIDEELKIFNKGKHGYLEKKAFLQRADERQFEIERNLRLTSRSNR